MNGLHLDAFEDFSIHNEDNIAISLHQCKIYKGKKTFAHEIQQMKDQFGVLSAQGTCNNKTKLFFHSNQAITDKIVKNYDKEMDGVSLGNKIEDQVREIVRKMKIGYPIKRICARLYHFVDSIVIKLHKAYCDDKKEKLVTLVRKEENAILMKDIFELVSSDDFSTCTDDDYSHQLKFNLIDTLNTILDESPDADDWNEEGLIMYPERALELVHQCTAIDLKSYPSIIQRIFAQWCYRLSEQHFRCTINDTNITQLIGNIGFCNFTLEDNIYWSRDGKYYTPAVFAPTQEIAICKALFRNRENLNCLREFDAIVVNRRINRIDDCGRKMMEIYEVEEWDDHNIFGEKAIAMMDVKEFNKISL